MQQMSSLVGEDDDVARVARAEQALQATFLGEDQKDESNFHETPFSASSHEEPSDYQEGSRLHGTGPFSSGSSASSRNFGSPSSSKDMGDPNRSSKAPSVSTAYNQNGQKGFGGKATNSLLSKASSKVTSSVFGSTKPEEGSPKGRVPTENAGLGSLTLQYKQPSSAVTSRKGLLGSDKNEWSGWNKNGWKPDQRDSKNWKSDKQIEADNTWNSYNSQTNSWKDWSGRGWNGIFDFEVFFSM